MGSYCNNLLEWSLNTVVKDSSGQGKISQLSSISTVYELIPGGIPYVILYLMLIMTSFSVHADSMQR